MDIGSLKHPLIIFYRKNEGEWLSSWERESNKSYSDVFSIDEVKYLFTSIAFISEKDNEINYIVSFRRNRMVATKKIRVSFDIVMKLDVPLTFNFITLNSTKAMIDQLESVFKSEKTIYYLNKYQLKTIIFSLSKLNEDYINKMKRIIISDKKINANDNKNYITSTERDALGIVLRINDLDNEQNKVLEWNIEETSTPDFIRNLNYLNVIEDQLIFKDSRCFGDWKIIDEDIHSICTLSNGINRVTIIYANRTKIENNTGVDLIYFDHVNNSYIFVQYKRLAEEHGKYIYRPKSDRNLNKELDLMKRLELNLSNDRSDYKINDQVFYFKFCRGKQEVYTKGLSNGFYMPKDYFLQSIELQKEKGKPNVISYETITRYLTNTVFIELIKSGLIGTKIDDAKLISNIIEELLSGKKSLILAASTHNNMIQLQR
jgi:hypothetical protein